MIFSCLKTPSLSGNEESKEPRAEIDLENWMRDLAGDILDKSIINIVIPGSHDSFTHNISKKSAKAPDLTKLLKHLPCIRMIANWAKTQRFNETDQLNCGTRYFDLRICTLHDDTTQFYICHGLISLRLEPVLNNIRNFLDTHLSEVVILDFNHFYDFNTNAHSNLKQVIFDTFNPLLQPSTRDLKGLTQGKLLVNNKRVLCIYRSPECPLAYCFPNWLWPSPWADTCKERVLFNRLDTYLEGRNPAYGFVSQCILTPDVAFVLLHLLANLKTACAKKLQKPLVEWLQTKKQLNIVIHDFVDLNDAQINRIIIQRNVH